MTIRSLLLVHSSVALILLTGCGRERSDERAPSTREAPKDDPAMELAVRARDALGQRLMARLSAAVSEGGHANAVEVCHAEAMPMTRAVAEEFGVKIGRTSERIRNPENEPPRWAEKMLEGRPTTQLQERDEDGTLHAIFPIVLAEPCLKCHGPEDQLATGVKDALAEHYPNDRATGFELGDLRGWFWVEVPPR
jgi:hypothetical protein